MTLIDTRPRVRWSSVANWRASTVGAVKMPRRSVTPALQAVGRVRVEREQRAIESGIFMRLGDGLDVIAIDDGTAARKDLRRIVIADEADEFHGHLGLAHGAGSVIPPRPRSAEPHRRDQ